MNGARVDVAVFTNFTRDHLDYHGQHGSLCRGQGKAVRLAAPAYRDHQSRRSAGPASWFVKRPRCACWATPSASRPRFPGAGARRATDVDTPFGQRFELVVPNGRAMVETALVGRYNIHNLLAVAAVLHDTGLSAAEVARRLSELTPPPGRMERLGGNGEPLVVVDYAHTPDALENALSALRDVATARGGRLCVVFGCGGDRDKGKRPQMGAKWPSPPRRPRAGDQRQPAQRGAAAHHCRHPRPAWPHAEVEADRAAGHPPRGAGSGRAMSLCWPARATSLTRKSPASAIRSPMSSRRRAALNLRRRRAAEEVVADELAALGQVAARRRRLRLQSAPMTGRNGVVHRHPGDCRWTSCSSRLRGERFDAHDFLAQAVGRRRQRRCW